MQSNQSIGCDVFSSDLELQNIPSLRIGNVAELGNKEIERLA